MSPNDYEMLSAQLKDGFTTVHKKIDVLREDFRDCQGRQAVLFGRIVEVEKQQAVDHALGDREEKHVKEIKGKKWDIWKIIVRSSIACSIPLLAGILGFLIWLSQNIKPS